MGPDEDHEHVTDNVYTNVAFQKAFKFARYQIKYFPKIIEHIYLKNYCSYTQSQCSPNSNHSSMDWLQHADNMFILYDSVNDFHPQHLGYQPGEEIKQADAILLGYPLQLKMN